MLQEDFEKDLQFSDLMENEFGCKCYWQGNYPLNLQEHFQKTIDSLKLSDTLFLGSAFNQYLCPMPNHFALYSKSGDLINAENWQKFISKHKKE